MIPRFSVKAEQTSVHTLVCDLDDTLYAEAGYVLSGFRAVDRWLIATHGLERFLPTATELFLRGLRGRIFDEALGAIGQKATSELVAAMVAVYRDHRPDIQLLPEVEAFLGKVAGNCRMGLLTDGYLGVQQRKVEALGIAGRFQAIVFTDALGREFWKPHTAAFRRIMEVLPGEAAGYVYVGDNPRKDFIAPRQLGWKTVRIRRAGGEHFGYDAKPGEAADREIFTLLDLPRILESW